jgi:NACHT domain
VLDDWSKELARRFTSDVPLPVPFTPATKFKGRIQVNTVTVNGEKEPVYEDDVEVTVMTRWSAIPHNPAEMSPKLYGTCDKIAEAFAVFRRMGLQNRLVVLGEPGAGKSILAQKLTVELVQQELDNPSIRAAREQPIPVFLQLATWDPEVPLNDWASVQLARTYPWLAEETEVQRGNGQTLAYSLITRGRVLMVLDGLDEIAADNQLKAFERLSVAATDEQSLIVTCRTKDYAQIVHDAGHAMPKTPVIQLDSLPLGKVNAYLDGLDDDDGVDRRFAKLTRRMAAEPNGALAQALGSPLALFLVTNVYRNIRTNPGELLTDRVTSGDARKIKEHLLNGLIPAVYANPSIDDLPARDKPEVEAIQRKLSKIAAYLGADDVEKNNINWWRLPLQVPNWFLGVPVGLVVGCLLGAAVGLAAATRFSAHAGVPFGTVFGVLTGLLAGFTAARPQDHPRAMDFRFEWDGQRFAECVTVGAAVGLTTAFADARHGGLIAGVITAAVVGPACARPCVIVFGPKPGITAGLAAALALGLSSGLAKGNGLPALSGLAAGAVFALAAWVFVALFQPSQKKLEVNPRALLDRDRIGCLTVAVTAGTAFAVVFGIALGPLLGVVAFVSLTITVTLTVSMWIAFNLSRIWLASAGMLPMAIMSFLHEAYCRGVLRQVGGSYQFRHIELQEALIDAGAKRTLAASEEQQDGAVAVAMTVVEGVAAAAGEVVAVIEGAAAVDGATVVEGGMGIEGTVIVEGGLAAEGSGA